MYTTYICWLMLIDWHLVFDNRGMCSSLSARLSFDRDKRLTTHDR